jgi:hypothetical protein
MAITMYYRVDFYEGAIDDKKVVFSLEPSTVPVAFAVGDFLDSRAGRKILYHLIALPNHGG